MERLYKQVKWLSIIAVVLSIYLSGFIDSVSTPDETFSPIGVFVHIVKHGFSFGIFAILMIISIFLIYLFYMRRKEDIENSDPLNRLIKYAEARQPYGSAHFERPKEYSNVALVQKPENAYGIIFGQLDMSGKRLINFKMKGNRLNQHIAVTGASGSGKTYTFTKPACFQYVKRRESVIITDPDGGLYSDMSSYFRDNGYHVFMLNLKDLEKSDGWNCLRSIEGANIDINAQIFANTVIANLTDDLTSIYAQGPMSLLKALILKVMLSPMFKDEERNIGTVYRLLQHPGGEAYLDSLFDFDSLSSAEKICHGPYMSFKQGSPNLRGNLITNLSTQLQLLQGDLVKKVLSTDGIDLELPGREPTAIFCLFPDDHDTYRFVVSLFFSMLFNRLVNMADRNFQNGKKLECPVNFLLDEFPSIGIIPDFDRKIATIRKRAMNVTMIFQDITQLQNNYRSTWVTLLSNCSTMYCLGINDMETAELVKTRIGETTIQVKTEQHEALENYMSVRRRNSTGEGRRPLLNADELVRLGEDKSLILFQNHNPILAYKLPYVDHPEAKKLRTINYYDPSDEGYIPSIYDEKAREEYRKREEDRVADFNRRHPGINDPDNRYVDYDYDEEDAYETEEGLIAYIKEEMKRHANNVAAAAEPFVNNVIWKAKKAEKKYFVDTREEDSGEVKVHKKNDVDVQYTDGFRVDRDIESLMLNEIEATNGWEEFNFDVFENDDKEIVDNSEPEKPEVKSEHQESTEAHAESSEETEEDPVAEEHPSDDRDDQEPVATSDQEAKIDDVAEREPDETIHLGNSSEESSPESTDEITKERTEKNEIESEKIRETGRDKPMAIGIDEIERRFKEKGSASTTKHKPSMFPTDEDRRAATRSIRPEDFSDLPPIHKKPPISNRDKKGKGKKSVLQSK